MAEAFHHGLPLLLERRSTEKVIAIESYQVTWFCGHTRSVSSTMIALVAAEHNVQIFHMLTR